MNGSLGYITNIVYKLGNISPNPSTYVTIEFDNYSGLSFDDHHPNIVPITPL